MSKPIFQFNDYVSLAVMLLMIVALVSGQTGANAAPTDNATGEAGRSPVSFSLDASEFELKGYLGADSLKISVDIDTKLDHFRGEDE